MLGCLALGEGREFLVVFKPFVDEVFCFQGFFVLYGGVVFGVDCPAVLVVGVEILDGGFEDAAVVLDFVVEFVGAGVESQVDAAVVFTAVEVTVGGDVPAGVTNVGAGRGDTCDDAGLLTAGPP